MTQGRSHLTLSQRNDLLGKEPKPRIRGRLVGSGVLIKASTKIMSLHPMLIIERLEL